MERIVVCKLQKEDIPDLEIYYGSPFISYVDLALDLWVSADGKQTVLDEDELAELNLSVDLKQKVDEGLKELQQLFKQKNPPN